MSHGSKERGEKQQVGWLGPGRTQRGKERGQGEEREGVSKRV